MVTLSGASEEALKNLAEVHCTRESMLSNGCMGRSVWSWASGPSASAH